MCYPTTTRRVVLDSSVVVSAFRKRSGESSRLLVLVEDGRLVPLSTPALFVEYKDVLERPEQQEASGLSLADVDPALTALVALMEPVEMRFTWRLRLADPGDGMVLDAAVNGRADALVTHNVTHFAAAAPRFGLTCGGRANCWKRIGRRAGVPTPSTR